MNHKIFTVSPGSTSTKLAIFEGNRMVFKASVTHDPDKLKSFKEISNQFDYRMETILKSLENASLTLEGVNAFAAYSGGLESMVGGIYPVNEILLQHSKEGRTVKHPAILGAQIIHDLAQKYKVPAYVVNPPDIDEFQDLARITGLKDVFRQSRIHALNQKEVAIRYATELEKKYEDCNFIVAHVGGGLSVTAHKKGAMVDSNDVINGDGPMAPNRSGQLPAFDVIKLCFSGKYSEKEMYNRISKTGGLMDHLGTDDTRIVGKRIVEGDAYAKLIYDGMIYQLSKSIGSYASVLEGKVDGIILTGGVSNDPYFVKGIEKYCSWIAEIKVYGGDFEMEALASGAIRALSGLEETKEYTGIPVWNGFKL